MQAALPGCLAEDGGKQEGFEEAVGLELGLFEGCTGQDGVEELQRVSLDSHCSLPAITTQTMMESQESGHSSAH